MDIIKYHILAYVHVVRICMLVVWPIWDETVGCRGIWSAVSERLRILTIGGRDRIHFAHLILKYISSKRLFKIRWNLSTSIQLTNRPEAKTKGRYLADICKWILWCILFKNLVGSPVAQLTICLARFMQILITEQAKQHFGQWWPRSVTP